MNYLNEEQIIDISKVVNLDYEFFAHKKELDNKIIYETERVCRYGAIPTNHRRS